MAVIVEDCPRCKAQRSTFDVKASNLRFFRYDWQQVFELFSVCRICHKGSIFVALAKDIDMAKYIKNESNQPHRIDGSLNDWFRFDGYISLRHEAAVEPPEHVPDLISNVFSEGASCLSIGCCNAACAMFRLCIDLATKDRLPEENVDGLNDKVRRSLGLRLAFLFRTGRLPNDLEELSTCIREDGNDGAHDGTLGVDDAEDVKDFTIELLDRLYTEPRRLELAKDRRNKRREKGGS